MLANFWLMTNSIKRGKRPGEPLYHGSNGPWAKASGRFVADTVGEVRLLGFAPASDSVFVQTELKAIVKLTKLTSSGKYTVQDLIALGSQVSVDVANGMTQGSVTLLYSGTVNGVGF